MDLMDEFDFDLEEVDRQANGRSSLDTASGASRPHEQSSVDKITNEVLHHTEGGVGRRASPDDQFEVSLDLSDDAFLDEVMQHVPGDFDHQDLAHEHCLISSQYVDDTVLDEDLQNADTLDHQASFHGKYMEPSELVSDSVPGKVIQHAVGRNGAQDPYDQNYMDSLDDTVFEEAMSIQEDLSPRKLPELPSMNSQGDLVQQQLSQDAGRDFNHRAPIHKINMQSSKYPANGEGLQCSHGTSSHIWAPAKEPDNESSETMALCEALQYAYKNNLTTDYLLPSFSITHIFSSLVQSTIPAAEDDGFTDHSHLPDAEIPNPVVLDKSKALTITPRAMRLIAGARLVQNEEDVQSLTEEVCNPDQSKPKKLELPILRTNNTRDLSIFKKRSLVRSDALLRSIKKHRLPFHPQNLEEGEGMDLSSQARAESVMMMKKSEEEKLGMTKNSLTYLMVQLKDDYTREDQMQFMIGEVKYEKTQRMEKITPPVSPQFIPKKPAPAFDPVQLPVPSDNSSSLLSDNFHAIEDIMLGDHQDVWSADTSPVRELLKDMVTISNQDAFLEHPRQTSDDLKVEVPLILDRASQQFGPAGPDAFNEFVEAEMDLDPEFEGAVLHDISDDNVEKQLQEQLEEAAQSALNSIEQEQLQAIDAVGRVPIPVMDFLMQEPAWKRLCGSSHNEISILKWIQAGKEQLFKPPNWLPGRAAGSKMVWSPFAPGAGNVPENEDMHEGESILKKFLELPPSKEIAISLDCTRQRRKPIVFGYDDHDENIETQLIRKSPIADLMKGVKKRTMDTNIEGTPKRPRHTIKQTPLNQATKHAGPSLLPGDSPGASGNLLANFMELHAPKKKVSTQSKYFHSARSDEPPRSAPTLTSRKHDNTQALEEPQASIQAPCPTIEPPATAVTVFISINIPPRMIRVLESLIPDLTLLERNYDAHNTFIWKPGSIVRTEVVPPLADDADITISASTGIIVTSMIRMRQKPRAGTNKGMVQIRVEKASLRYERLIVLVGGERGKEDVVEVMSSSDSTALLELHGFASGLESNVQVHYVGGGEKTLANWVATFICRHSLSDPQIVAALLEPETLWEIFLRRAGFNVFAAQAVASHFKAPTDESDTVPSARCGLGAFMTMTRDERMRRFGQLVGTRTLERVSRNVDELWNRG